MKKRYPAVRRAAALIVSAVLLASCSIPVMPNNVPQVKDSATISLTGVSLIVMNAEKDSSAYKILSDKGENLGFVADRQAWSKELVKALASELAKRGGLVRANAPLALSIALPEITMNLSGDAYRFKLKLAVSSSTGWSNNYEAAAETKSGLFESANAMADRLAGLALAEAVKAMLNDAEFVSKLSGTKSERIAEKK